MRTFAALLLFPALFATPAAHAQAAPPPTASSILSPALGTLRESLSGLRLDKWKAPGPVRQEANSNIGSITRDLDGTLPPLLSAADAAPGVVSQTLPVFRNVDALYDVLLRVVETADLSAPDDDTETLHKALTTLEDARRNFGDAIEGAAVAQEKQMAALSERVRVQTVPVVRGPVPVTAVTDGDKPSAAATHHRKPVKPKPAAAPAPPQQ